MAIALLPVIAVQAYNEFDLRRARQLEVQSQAISLAKLAAAEQQQIVQGIRQVLIALSELPAIKARDSKACNAYLAAMKQRFPAFITVHRRGFEWPELSVTQTAFTDRSISPHGPTLRTP